MNIVSLAGGIVDIGFDFAETIANGVPIDVVFDSNGLADISVINADSRVVYGLTYNTTVDDLSFPERYQEGNTGLIRLRATNSVSGAGKRVVGFYR